MGGRNLLYNRQIEDLYRAYAQDVYNFLVYFTGSRDVEDLVQETFIKALKSIDTYRHVGTPKSWLFTIAKNAAVDWMRKQKNADIASEEIPIANCSGIEDVVEFREQRRVLVSALFKLKPNYRAVLILRGVEGMSVKETAHVLGWSQGKVRTTYHRALQVVKGYVSSLENGGMQRGMVK